MKKLLVLMLVLGMSAMANAGLVLSIGGEPAPDEYTLKPSEGITIDLKLVDGQSSKMIDVSFMLSNAQAALDASGITFPDSFTDFPTALILATPQEVRVSGSQFFSPDLQAPATLVDNLVLHCEEATPVTLDLVVKGGTMLDGQTLDTGTILDSISIVQIPEPATLLLLGLGGLFLRRRK